MIVFAKNLQYRCKKERKRIVYYRIVKKGVNNATFIIKIRLFHIQPFYRILGIIYNLHIVKNPSQTIM